MSGPYRHIGVTKQEGVLILTVELEQVRDYLVAEELRYEMVHAVKSRQSDLVVLDLGQMTFMTSLACVAFIGVKQALRDTGGRIALCNMSDFIRKVFHAKRLLTRSPHSGNVAFEEADTLEDAVALLLQAG